MQIFTWILTFTLSFLPAAGFAPGLDPDGSNATTEEEEWSPGIDPNGLQVQSQDGSALGDWKPGIDPNGVTVSPSQSEMDETN